MTDQKTDLERKKSLSATASETGDFEVRRRDIMQKLAMSAIAAPAVLIAVSTRPAAASVISPPPP